MRVGFILPSLPNYSETFFQSQISGLAENGYIITLFINKNAKEKLTLHESVKIYLQPDVNKKIRLLINLLRFLVCYPLLSLKYIRLERLSNRSWREILKNVIINSHILTKKLDWIHFGFATMGIQRENVASAIGAKSAVSFRGYDIGLYPHKHPNCYSLLWQKIDKVHTISDDLYQKAVDLGLDSKIPYEKIIPAINIEFFKSNIDKDLHNPLRILTVGRLTWKKGYEYALKALVLLKNAQINFEYHIVGEGHYREAIMYSIYQLGLTKNVMLKGKISPVEVKNEMEWADIYIQPSIQEGFCNAVLEAQAMGLLCIVTNAEGLSENVIDGTTGWVVPRRSANSIANSLLKIIDMSPDSLKIIQDSAAFRVKEKFNLTQQNELFRNFYTQK